MVNWPERTAGAHPFRVHNRAQGFIIQSLHDPCGLFPGPRVTGQIEEDLFGAGNALGVNRFRSALFPVLLPALLAGRSPDRVLCVFLRESEIQQRALMRKTQPVRLAHRHRTLEACRRIVTRPVVEGEAVLVELQLAGEVLPEVLHSEEQTGLADVRAQYTCRAPCHVGSPVRQVVRAVIVLYQATGLHPAPAGERG